MARPMSAFGRIVLVLLFGLGASPAVGTEGSVESVTLGDYQNYTKGSYSAFMAPFNAGALRPSRDFTETLVLRPDTFPDATSIAWQWPNIPCPVGIYNFLAVQYGNYDHTRPQMPITSRK